MKVRSDASALARHSTQADLPRPSILQTDSKATEDAIRVRLADLNSAKATQLGERSGLQKQLVRLVLLNLD